MGVVMGRRQRWTFYEVTSRVVEEPILVRLEGLDDRVSQGGCMVTGMLRGRRVAATDVAAVGAAT
jgi:hypothetical protein